MTDLMASIVDLGSRQGLHDRGMTESIRTLGLYLLAQSWLGLESRSLPSCSSEISVRPSF